MKKENRKTSRRSVLKSFGAACLSFCGLVPRTSTEQNDFKQNISIPEEEKIPIYIFPGGRRVPKEECRRITETRKMLRERGCNAYLPVVDGQEVALEWFSINIDTGEFKTHYWS